MTQIASPQLNKSQIIKAKHIQVELPAQPIKYYRHGWQSWSLAAWTDIKPVPIQKPTIFHPLHIDIEYAYEKNPHGSWLGAVEFANGKILLLGALSLNTHVFQAQNQLEGKSEADEAEWLIMYGDENQVFDEYIKQLKNRFGYVEKNHAPRVWCSWYSLYTVIDEKILFKTFDLLGDLPFEVLQVDDGWQKNIGDWEANKKFPSGMKALADKIKSTGRRAGLWLAPLIASKSSTLFNEHPDWFLKNERGKFVSAGFNWGEYLFALDVTHPEAQKWLVTLMKQVRAWGFDYFKLDFLYAGALKGKRYNDMPRESAYRECLKLMYEAMGENAFFLTCGTPILPAIGVCNAIRIGPDVSHEWENYRNEVLFYNPSTPSVKNAIRTAAHRLWLKDLVHIDPDVEYFESKENFLEEEHKIQLQELALICNFKATSDLPQWMTAEEREQVRKFLLAEPKVKQLSRYVYQLDDRVVDFSSAVALPNAPKGLTKLWGDFLGWLGNFPFVLRIFKWLDDEKLRKRRQSLEA